MGRKKGSGRTARTRSDNEWLKNNPSRRLAQQAVKRAKKRGQLTGAGYCTFCGTNDGPFQFHHPDIGYDASHDLDVIEVCDPCHRRWHMIVDRWLRRVGAWRTKNEAQDWEVE